jgi:hypothetical protein
MGHEFPFPDHHQVIDHGSVGTVCEGLWVESARLNEEENHNKSHLLWPPKMLIMPPTFIPDPSMRLVTWLHSIQGFFQLNITLTSTTCQCILCPLRLSEHSTWSLAQENRPYEIVSKINLDLISWFKPSTTKERAGFGLINNCWWSWL